MRLDDACDQRDVRRWNRLEELLDKYNVKPLVGVIPNCEDAMMESYECDTNFWERVISWRDKGWTIAMHGYNHVYDTNYGGLNPVNRRSEFAGKSLELQKEKIEKGVAIMRKNGINPLVFFAPSHTFDENTLIALQECSDIRIISDTIANEPYTDYGMTFIPQQSGKVRNLPFKITTFCYHPNMMEEKHFEELELFLCKYHKKFIDFPIINSNRKKDVIDKILNLVYMRRHR